MERPWKLKTKGLINFLPKTETPATFLNSPRSPVRSPIRRGTLVPKEARRRSKNGSSFEWREPTSPKVSCMGRVSRSKMTKSNKPKLANSPQKASSPSFSSPRKQIIMIGKILKGSKSAKKCEEEDGVPASAPPPPLGQMKRLESGRGGALQHFDWKNTVSDDDDKLVLPNLESMDGPRKEVNLWRRRSMAPPAPLRI